MRAGVGMYLLKENNRNINMFTQLPSKIVVHEAVHGQRNIRSVLRGSDR